MELRSKRKIIEFRALENTLCGLGMYEDGMQLEEMQQLMQALQQSELENETVFLDNDMERALKESELDFTQMQRDAHNSTMIKCNGETIDGNANTLKHHYGPNLHRAHVGLSPINSPEMAMQTLTIQAEVHHPYDWSPPRHGHRVLKLEERTGRKRISTEPSANSTTENAVGRHDVKRSRLPCTTISPPHGHSNDSGIHSSSVGSADASVLDANSYNSGVTASNSHSFDEQ